jgi:bidirectional [NiFe] hydrogenase diaphorase subunit
MVTLTVDGRTIQAPAGSSVLSACLSAGITIPHLCRLETDTPDEAPASCRLCFVEVDGIRDPVTACSLTVENGMTVRTGSEAVRKLQKTALKLLLSVHRVDCKHCPANRACALQDIARFLGVGLGCKPYERVLGEPEVDSRHPVFDHYRNRCVLCGICVRLCSRRHRWPRLSFAGRGFDTVVGNFDGDVNTAAECVSCRACIDACPTGALVEKAVLNADSCTLKGTSDY